MAKGAGNICEVSTANQEFWEKTNMGSQMQMDLVDMSKYERENEDYWWILTAIDVFSRYCLPFPSKESTKTLLWLLSKGFWNGMKKVW